MRLTAAICLLSDEGFNEAIVERARPEYKRAQRYEAALRDLQRFCLDSANSSRIITRTEILRICDTALEEQPK